MGNPLKVFRSHGMFVLSSESTDQGSINIEPYKCFTINYKDNSLAVRDITLNYTSYSVSNSCGVPANSDTDCDYKYKTSKHSIGFNTHRIYAPSTIADDVEGVKPTTILLGNSITNNNNTVFICNTTGRITTNCYCRLHIELTKSLKAKEPLKIGTENGEIITYPKKIRSPYNMDSSRDCEICGEDNTIEPMTYDTVENCWIHSKCESPKIFDSIKNEDEFVEQARIQRIQLVSEVEKLEEIVDDLSEEARVVEHNNSDVEKWFKLQSKIDVVKRDIDNKNRLIIRAEEFIGNQIF